jgi:hypothetical protein
MPFFTRRRGVLRGGFLFFLLLSTIAEPQAWPRWSKKKKAAEEAAAKVKTEQAAENAAGENPALTPAGGAVKTASVKTPFPLVPGEKPEVAALAFPPAVPLFPIPDLPKLARPILGKGTTPAKRLRAFLLSVNGRADKKFTEDLAAFYVTEAEAEGINHDIAFAQMCLETGFLRFGGLVSPEMNNFCGLGSIGPGEPGERFSSVQLGVRAHIQHLKAYATDLPLKGELVDPRYRLVRRGSSPAVQGLAGTWAADREYADKIEAILLRLYSFQD